MAGRGFRCGLGRGNEHLDVYVSGIEPSSASQAPVFKIQGRREAEVEGGGRCRDYFVSLPIKLILRVDRTRLSGDIGIKQLHSSCFSPGHVLEPYEGTSFTSFAELTYKTFMLAK